MISTESFQKSSFSGNGGCVEVWQRDANAILLRDSKNPKKEPFEFTAQEWVAFLAGVRGGEFDLG